jgi:hypothetical protein
MMVEQPVEPQKRKRPRSPGYPGIDLGEALERARLIYQREGRNAAPVNTILGHWGYKPMSGPGLTALSALKKFGLVVYEGSGEKMRARLSDVALAVLLDEREESPARLQLIQEAAISPSIHNDLWQKYGASLPSDETLRFELRHDRNFTEAGVAEFIPQYKRTLDFARLGERGKLSEEAEDKTEDEGEGLMTSSTTFSEAPTKPKKGEHESRRASRIIQLPISPSEWAALQAPFPLTEGQWKQMLAVLEAMKPALIRTENGRESHQEESGE